MKRVKKEVESFSGTKKHFSKLPCVKGRQGPRLASQTAAGEEGHGQVEDQIKG